MEAGIRLLLSDPRTDFSAINMTGECPLSMACARGDAVIVTDLLASTRIDLRLSGSRALMQAIVREPSLVQQLLAHPDIDVNPPPQFLTFQGLRFAPFGYDIMACEPTRTVACESPLVAAAFEMMYQFINPILAHASFDATRTSVAAAVFASIEFDDVNAFAALLPNDLTTRSPCAGTLVLVLHWPISVSLRATMIRSGNGRTGGYVRLINARASIWVIKRLTCSGRGHFVRSPCAHGSSSTAS
jgi:hypothetical protein